jgi:hypothetical protein
MHSPESQRGCTGAPIGALQAEPKDWKQLFMLSWANGSPVRTSLIIMIGKNVKQDDSNNEVTVSGCGEQIDDILDGLVGAVIGGFESTVWAMSRVWSVVEAAIGKWSAQPSQRRPCCRRFSLRRNPSGRGSSIRPTRAGRCRAGVEALVADPAVARRSLRHSPGRGRQQGRQAQSHSRGVAHRQAGLARHRL